MDVVVLQIMAFMMAAASFFSTRPQPYRCRVKLFSLFFENT